MVESSTTVDIASNDLFETKVTRVIREFISNLHAMRFEKARELIDTERLQPVNSSLYNRSSIRLWQSLLGFFSQLSIPESSYFSFNMFWTKFTFRKDTHIREIYIQMKNEINRAIIDADALILSSNLDIKENSVEKLLVTMHKRLLLFVTIRIDLIDFYVSLPSKNWANAADICCKRLEEISGTTTETLLPKDLDIFDACKNEISILQRLFTIQQSIVACNMFDSLIAIKQLRSLLLKWFSQFECGTATKPTSSFLFSFTKKVKNSEKLALPLFINQFYQLILAKFSLYFYDVLSTFLPPNELKTAFNIPNGFLQIFQNFHRKTNPQITCILVSRIDLQMPFYGFGYHHFLNRFSSEYCKPASGIQEKYPTLFVFPQDKRVFDAYYVNILTFVQEIFLSQSVNVISVSSIANATSSLAAFSNANLSNVGNDTRIKYLYDKSKDQTFFATNIESNIYMAVAYDRKVQERENIVINFFNEVLQSLRFVKLFQDLRSSAKCT